MRTLVALLALLVPAAGCSVDVGAGSIAPIMIDAPIDAALGSPPLSLDMELTFLSADQSQSIADQYGNKLGAVSAVDVDVEALTVVDGAGAPVAGATLILSFEGVTVDHSGDRLRLPDAVKQKVLTAIAQHAALDLPLRVTAGWAAPSSVPLTAHATLQPIVVVDALRAL